MPADLNDPRITIPTLHRGDPIRESYLRDITNGINGRRGVSNPPQQLYNKPPISGSSELVKAKSWCCPKKQSPSTVTLLNSDAVYAASDTNSSYDGTTIGYKILLNFERQVTIKNSSHLPILMLGLCEDISPTGLATSRTGASGHISGTITSAVAISARFYVRCRLVTASFTTSTQTWNSLGSLTIGSTVFDDAYFAGDLTLPSGITGSHSWPLDSQMSPISLASPTSNYLSMLSFIFNSAVLTSSAFTCYGLLIDCKPVLDASTSGLSVADACSLLSVNLGRFSTGVTSPYLIRPA